MRANCITAYVARRRHPLRRHTLFGAFVQLIDVLTVSIPKGARRDVATMRRAVECPSKITGSFGHGEKTPVFVQTAGPCGLSESYRIMFLSHT